MRKVNPTILLVFSMALVSMMCLFFSVSYSYVTESGSSSKTQSIKTGNLSANIVYENADYLEMEPLSDADGLSQATYGTISVSKNNQYSVYYQLNLKYSSPLPSGKTSGDLIPLENVKVALYKIENNVIGATPVVGPVRIGDLPIAKYDDNILNTEYKLYVNKFSAGNDSSKYAIKVWLDEDIDETFDDKLLYLDAAIIQEPLMSKNYYNLTGKVLLNGTPITGAEVMINGNTEKSTSNASGIYTLSSVVEGKYKLVVKYNNITYEKVLTITGSDTKKVVKNSGKEIAAGITVQKAAYENNTTPYRIMLANKAIENSNETTKYPYNVPDYYEIFGLQSLGVQELGNININITGNDINIEYEAKA